MKLMIALQMLATVVVIGLGQQASATEQCKEIRWLGKYSRMFKADNPNLEQCIANYCREAKYSLVTSNQNFFTYPDIKKFALTEPYKVKNCATHYTEDGRGLILDTFEAATEKVIMDQIKERGCSHLFMGNGEATTCEIVYE